MKFPSKYTYDKLQLCNRCNFPFEMTLIFYRI